MPLTYKLPPGPVLQMKLPSNGYPSTRLGWHYYYVGIYNRTEHKDAAALAMAYLMLHLAFDAKDDENATT